MDELRRQAASLAERWQRFPRGQRIAMTAVLVASVVGFSFVIGRSTGSDWQPVCGGREFAGKELAATQAIWRQQGLRNFRKEGQQIYVPKVELNRYEALVPKSKSDEVASSSEWERQLSKSNPFSSSEVVEQHRDNALRNELRRIIKAIPAIADAEVIWARSKGKSTFSARANVKATVNVTPRDGHDVTPELAQSLRTAVANMVPDLNVQDVVVLDQSTGLAIADHMDAAIVQQQRRRQLERLSQQVENKITLALSSIPGIVVQIAPSEAKGNNHFVARPIQTELAEGNDQREFRSASFWTHDAPQDVVLFANDARTARTFPVPADSAIESPDQPHHWRVTVAVPASYFEAQAAQSVIANGHATDSSDAECARLQQLVTSLLPANAPTTEVVVQQSNVSSRSLTVPETQSAIAGFAAWPHAVSLLVGVVVMASFARPRRRAVVRQECHDKRSLESDVLSVDVDFTNQSTLRLVTPKQFDGSRKNPLPLKETAPTQVPLTDPTREISSDTEFDQQRQPNHANRSDDNALSQLLQADPQRLAEALRHEGPQAIAVLLTRFPTRHASETLAGLPNDMQIDIIRRLKSLSEVSLELVDEIARSVSGRLQLASPVHASNGPHSVNRIAHLLEAPSSSRVFA